MFNTKIPEALSHWCSGTAEDVGSLILVTLKWPHHDDEIALSIGELYDARPGEALQPNAAQIEEKTTVVDTEAMLHTSSGLESTQSYHIRVHFFPFLTK